MVHCPLFPFPLPALKRAQKSYQEAIMWKHARHPNIVPFLGITSTPFQLVSNWMPGGNLVGYIKENPSTDRLGLVRFPPTRDANFSHSASCLGSLKLYITSTPATLSMETSKGHVNSEKKYYPNQLTKILAKHTYRRCRARTSYGIWPCHRSSGPGTHPTRSRVLFHTMDRTGDPTGGNWHKQGNGHLFVWDGRDRGMNHDIVPIGCVINQYKAFSGAAPFADSTPASVVAKVLLGELPKRPNDSILTDGLWDLTRRCLDQNPRQRPEITEVVLYLRRVLAIRQDRADSTDANKDDMNVGCICPWGQFYRASSSINSSEIIPTGFKDTNHSMPLYRLRRPCELKKASSEPGYAFDSDRSIYSKELWDSPQHTELGGSESHQTVKIAPYGSRNVLRRSFLSLGCGVSSVEDHQDDMPVLSAEQRPHTTVDTSKGSVSSSVNGSRSNSRQWKG